THSTLKRRASERKADAAEATLARQEEVASKTEGAEPAVADAVLPDVTAEASPPGSKSSWLAESRRQRARSPYVTMTAVIETNPESWTEDPIYQAKGEYRIRARQMPASFQFEVPDRRVFRG